MSNTIENTVENEQIEKKRCFIITPVGPDNSPIRRAAEGVIDSAIIPVLEELNFETDVPHRLFSSGSITKAVINNIVNDDLVIANLTGLNPNVMYELGIRHTARRPIVHICESGTQLPFDIAPERTLFYVNDMLGIKEFRPKLRDFIIAAINEEEPSNPVYDAIQAKSIMQHVDNKDPLKYVIKAIEELKSGFIRNNRTDFNENINKENRSRYDKGNSYIELSCIIKSGCIPADEILDGLHKLITSKFNCPTEIGIVADHNNLNMIVTLPPGAIKHFTEIEISIREYMRIQNIEIE